MSSISVTRSSTFLQPSYPYLGWHWSDTIALCSTFSSPMYYGDATSVNWRVPNPLACWMPGSHRTMTRRYQFLTRRLKIQRAGLPFREKRDLRGTRGFPNDARLSNRSVNFNPFGKTSLWLDDASSVSFCFRIMKILLIASIIYSAYAVFSYALLLSRWISRLTSQTFFKFAANFLQLGNVSDLPVALALSAIDSYGKLTEKKSRTRLARDIPIATSNWYVFRRFRKVGGIQF